MELSLGDELPMGAADEDVPTALASPRLGVSSLAAPPELHRRSLSSQDFLFMGTAFGSVESNITSFLAKEIWVTPVTPSCDPLPFPSSPSNSLFRMSQLGRMCTLP